MKDARVPRHSAGIHDRGIGPDARNHEVDVGYVDVQQQQVATAARQVGIGTVTRGLVADR
jgi:hypothetical protein